LAHNVLAHVANFQLLHLRLALVDLDGVPDLSLLALRRFPLRQKVCKQTTIKKKKKKKAAEKPALALLKDSTSSSAASSAALPSSRAAEMVSICVCILC
jgi:hypothetical protein